LQDRSPGRIGTSSEIFFCLSKKSQ